MKALKVVAAHLLWLVNGLFGAWLLYISRNTWLALFDRYYINGSPTYANRALFMDRIFSILLGLAWFFMIIFTQSYFLNGVAKNDMMRRFAKASGPIVLAIYGVDVILALTQGLTNIGWSRFVIILVELVLGIALVRLGQVKKVSSQSVGQH
jgi:hypothetical protein